MHILIMWVYQDECRPGQGSSSKDDDEDQSMMFSKADAVNYETGAGTAMLQNATPLETSLKNRSQSLARLLSTGW